MDFKFYSFWLIFSVCTSVLAVFHKLPFIEGKQKYRKVINFSVFGKVLKINWILLR